MMTLKLIQGSKKEEVDSYLIYYEALLRTIQKTSEIDSDLSESDSIRRIVWHGIKAFSFYIGRERSKDYESLSDALNMIDVINGLIKRLTVSDFTNMFPIDKVFDGEKYCSKDYYTTKKYLESFSVCESLDDRVQDLLWEYQNTEIRKYLVAALSIASGLRRLQGEKGIMEEFIEDKGIASFTKTKDIQGKDTMIDNQTGETYAVKKKIPKYLKIVK